MKVVLCASVAILLLPYAVFGQTITLTNDADQLAQRLIGVNTSIVNVSGVSYIGDPTAAGLIPAHDWGVLLGHSIRLSEDGIILSSGAADMSGAHDPTPGDAAFAQYLGDLYNDGAPIVSNDAAVLEFTFHVAPGLTSVGFEILYVTREYPDFEGYIDGAAIFVDGVNCAVYQRPDGSIHPLTTTYLDLFLDNTSGVIPSFPGGVTQRYRCNALLATDVNGQAHTVPHTIRILVHNTLDNGYASTFMVSRMTTGNASAGGVAPPILVNNTGVSMTRGTLIAITSSMLLAEGPDHSALTYTLTTPPQHGTVMKSFVTLAQGSTWTQTDIDSSRISVLNDGDPAITDAFTFSISDGSDAYSANFVTNILAINNAPTIGEVNDTSANAGETVSSIDVVLGDAETPAAALSLTAVSGNQSVIPDSDIVIGGGGASRTLSLTTHENMEGFATIILTVSDGAQQTVDSFQVHVVSPQPVQLVDFSASPAAGGRTRLMWKTASETNNYGFFVERAVKDENNFTTLGFVKGHGTTVAAHQYEFTDTAHFSGAASYRLKQVDLDGSPHWSEPVSVVLTGVRDVVVTEYALEQNFPNPFNPTTVIRYALPERGSVRLTVINALGQQIASLVQGMQEAGVHQVRFDGAGLASGTYFYRIQAGNFVQTKKFLLLR